MKNLRQICGGLLFVNFVLFAYALSIYLTPPPTTTIVKTSLTERDLAIADAQARGVSEYSYTTNFIPGIGTINDPAAYKKAWEDQYTIDKEEPSN